MHQHHLVPMKTTPTKHLHGKPRRRWVLRSMCAIVLALCAVVGLSICRYDTSAFATSKTSIATAHHAHDMEHRPQPTLHERVFQDFFRWADNEKEPLLDPDKNATLIVLGGAAEALQRSLASVRQSGFHGRIVVLCHADVETCERMQTLVGGPLTVQRVVGTVLARMSGQLLLVSAYGYLQDAQQRGELPETVVVMDGQEVRWCGNVFQRLRSSFQPTEVAMVSTAAWSVDMEGSYNWTMSFVRPNRPAGRPLVTSGNFVAGRGIAVLAMLEAVGTVMDQYRAPFNAPVVAILGASSSAITTVLAKRSVSLVGYKFGSFTKPNVCEHQLANRPGPNCGPETDVIVELSQCEDVPAVDDGVHRYQLECRTPLASRIYTMASADSPPARSAPLAAMVPKPVAAEWAAMKRAVASPEQEAVAPMPRRSRFSRCPVGRQSLIVAMAWTRDPSEVLPLLGSFALLSSLRRNCTNLLIMARNTDLWEQRLEGTQLQGYVRILPTLPYEGAQECHAMGPSMCRHGILAEWLMQHPQTASSIGLIMTVDLLVSEPFLQADPFTELVDVHEHEIHELVVGFSTKDFIALPTSSEGASVLDWANPAVFHRHHDALSQLFGLAFTNAAYELSLGDLSSSSTATPSFQEPIPAFSAASLIATPRALLHFTKLFKATAAATLRLSPLHDVRDVAVHHNAIVFALVAAGLRESGYPYPVYLLNPSHSPMVRFAFVRRGDIRSVVALHSPNVQAFVTCDGRPYAIVQAKEARDAFAVTLAYYAAVGAKALATA